MYLALFLMPWMIIYALSGLVLNHHPAVRALYGARIGQMEKIEERAYTATFSENADTRMIGGQILEDLGLSGTFNVIGTPAQPRLIINRNGAFSQHRITYFRTENRLLVEKQSFSAPVFVNRAHFRHGYEQPFLAAKSWGLIVDLAIAGMVLWVFTGLLMWWEVKPARLAGAGFAVVGVGLFAIMLFTI
jgi:hypothetical protein